MSKHSENPTPTPARNGPSWPSYRATQAARAEARRQDVNVPWLLWLMLVQPRLALIRLCESGAIPFATAALVVFLAALVQAATVYSRNALIVATGNALAAQQLPWPAPLQALASLSPATLLISLTTTGFVLWLLLSLLTWAYMRMIGTDAPPSLRQVATLLGFCAMPLLAEAVLLPFLLLLEGGFLYVVETIFKLLLVPWTLYLVYCALRSLDLKRGQTISVMLLTFFTLQFIAVFIFGTILWQLLTALAAQAGIG